MGRATADDSVRRMAAIFRDIDSGKMQIEAARDNACSQPYVFKLLQRREELRTTGAVAGLGEAATANLRRAVRESAGDARLVEFRGAFDRLPDEYVMRHVRSVCGTMPPAQMAARFVRFRWAEKTDNGWRKTRRP